MRLARVTGTVTATAKPASLSGRSLLLVDVVDADDTTLETAVVAADTCGAGTGDLVLLAQGSAARLLTDTSGIPIDCAVIAVVDTVSHKPR